MTSTMVMQLWTMKWAGLAFGATATLGIAMGWSAAWAQQRELRPNEIVARLFPPEWSPPRSLPRRSEQSGVSERQMAFDPKFNSYSTLALPTLPFPLADVFKQGPAKPTESPSANARSAFFNEAQIASIKDRLKLTPQQARYWPAVESALRAIAWRKTREGTAILDPDGVQRLNVAARELVKNLSEVQKREVQTLVHLVGLKNQQ
jgi:hypothetical protein